MTPGPQRGAKRWRPQMIHIVSGLGGLTAGGASLLLSGYPAVFRILANVLIVLGFVALPPNGIIKRRSGRGGAVAGRDQDDVEGLAGRPAGPWQALSLISRLMPRSAGGRWLAEAESLLSEIAADRRGAAIRSYLLSAPRLVALMWAREVSRRARLGPRRPG